MIIFSYEERVQKAIGKKQEPHVEEIGISLKNIKLQNEIEDKSRTYSSTPCPNLILHKIYSL